MKRAAMDAAAGRRADHDGHARAPAVTAFGREIDDLVVGAGDEIRKLDFGDRPQPHEAGADGRAHNRRFGDGCVNDATLTETLQHSGRDLEGATIYADIFPYHEYSFVALHLFPETCADGLQICAGHLPISRRRHYPEAPMGPD